MRLVIRFGFVYVTVGSSYINFYIKLISNYMLRYKI